MLQMRCIIIRSGAHSIKKDVKHFIKNCYACQKMCQKKTHHSSIHSLSLLWSQCKKFIWTQLVLLTQSQWMWRMWSALPDDLLKVKKALKLKNEVRMKNPNHELITMKDMFMFRLQIISNPRICTSTIDNSDLKHLILQSIILVRPHR